MLCFDVRRAHCNAAQQWLPACLYCVLCHTLLPRKINLICKWKMYAKLKSTFDTMEIKEEQEGGCVFKTHISIWNGSRSCFSPSHENGIGTDEGSSSFILLTSLAVMMMTLEQCEEGDSGHTLENLWEQEENCRRSTLKSSSFVSSSSVSRWWYLSERAVKEERIIFYKLHYYRLFLLQCKKMTQVEKEYND